MNRLFVVRHGQTQWNVQGLLQGSTDIALSDAGRAQAATMAVALARVVSPDAVLVSSDLSRAHDTALALARVMDVPVAVDARLRERAYGPWEGITARAREYGWPQEVRAWHEGGDPGLPGFEVHGVVRARMVAAIEEWTERTPGDLVVFTHGSSARVGMMGLLGLPLTHRTLANLGNTCWSRLRRREDGGWTLERHNESADVLYPGGVP